MKNNNSTIQQFNNFLIQLVPLFLTGITFLVLSIVLYSFIHALNLLPIHDKIVPKIHVADILVGLTIYLKTSVDFALFIGNLMSKYVGIKNRIAIEIGTAAGNAAGTFFVLLIWTFFKEVPLLMVIMILLAALVLLHMAQEGLGEFNKIYKNIVLLFLQKVLEKIAFFTSPLLLSTY